MWQFPLVLALSLISPATDPSSQPTSQPATVAAAASSQPSADIAALIEKLNDDDWSTRQSAEAQLVALGAAAIPALRDAADNSQQEEVRERAAEALGQISENQTIGPSIITIHEKQIAPRELFAELSRQAGATLEPAQPEMWDARSWPPVNVDIDAKPFWAAMHDIADLTGVDLRPWNEGLVLQFAQGRQPTGRPFISGPFLISLIRENRSQTIQLGETDTQTYSEFALFFSAMVEPKLRVLRASYIPTIDEAIDDKGQSLRSEDGNDDAQIARRNMALQESLNPTNGTGMWNFQAKLSSKARGGRLMRLRGTIGVELETGVDTVEIRDIATANNVSRSSGGLLLTVLTAKRDGQRFDISLKVTRDVQNGASAAPVNRALMQGERIDWQRVQQCISELKIVDDQDRPLRRMNFGSTGDDQSIQLNLSFVSDVVVRVPGARRTRGSEPSKLIWRVPTETREERVPFEFRDLPLPD